MAVDLPSPHLQVEALDGTDGGRDLLFPAPGTIVLGREGTSDVRLQRLRDPSVASRHLLVTVDRDFRIHLDALEGAGAVFVGDRRLDHAEVASGALIRLGETVLRLSVVQHDVLTEGVRRRRLSDFEIVEEVGSGAFSRVYHARERASGRDVALKRMMLDDPRDRETLISAFLREVQTSASLDHPCIISVSAAGRKGNDLFLVMDFVDGPDLDSWVGIEGALPVDTVSHLAQDLLGALEHAHARGVLHRDLKPSNVMFDLTQGALRPVLVDFGLAIQSERLATWGLTHEGDLRGTPEFLAPECLEDARAHSVRSDLYGIAATLFFALTGEAPPRRGGSAVEIKRRLVAACGAGNPLAGTIFGALRVDPTRRWRSARAMRAALPTAASRA